MTVDLARLLALPLPKVPVRRTQIELSAALQEAVDEGARTKDLEGITALLDEGADPNRDPENGGPLMEAMRLQWWEGAHLLHERGARIPESLRDHLPNNVHALLYAINSPDPAHLHWVHHTLNGGQVGVGWAGKHFESVIAGAVRHHPRMLGFFMDHATGLQPALWFRALVGQVVHHGGVEEGLAKQLGACSPLDLDEERVVWCHALCSARPREAVEVLSRFLPVHLLDGPANLPMALHVVRCNQPATLAWLLQDPAIHAHLHAHLAAHPGDLEALFCFPHKVHPSHLTTNHPLYLMGVPLWGVLEKEGLLPDDSTMGGWKSGHVFCLLNLIESGLLTPDTVEWVARHWPDALTHVWTDAPSAMDVMDTAHREGRLPFDGRVLAERVLLEERLRTSPAKGRTPRL